MVDWSEGVITAKAALRRAEHQLALGRKERGRDALAEAVQALIEAIEAIDVPDERTAT